MSEDSFGCHNWELRYWHLGMEAGMLLNILQCTDSPTQNNLIQYIKSAETEKPWSNLTRLGDCQGRPT